LLLPFAGEERLDRLASLKEFRAVAPAARLGIGERDAFGVAGIPGVFRHARLLRGGLSGERRKRRAGHDDLLATSDMKTGGRNLSPLLAKSIALWLSTDRYSRSAF